MIGLRTGVGARPHRVTLQNPLGPPVPKPGGFTQAYADLVPPTVYAAIAVPTGKDLERLAAGTVISSAMKVVTFPFHPQVTTKTRASWVDMSGRTHTANVTGVDNPEERCIETVCLCVEIVA
ncbi:MAG: hypothetical protein ABJA98_01715 [Acidobacteriota bacterium]